MYNGHADVTALIDGTGAVIASYYYDAFGNPDEDTKANALKNVKNNITYAGYQYDGDTGLYYLNARMYDAKIARFLQEDTYRGRANDPLSLNLYTYCHNEPVMYDDPTGHAYVSISGLGIVNTNTNKVKTPKPVTTPKPKPSQQLSSNGVPVSITQTPKPAPTPTPKPSQQLSSNGVPVSITQNANNSTTSQGTGKDEVKKSEGGTTYKKGDIIQEGVYDRVESRTRI